MRVSRFSIAGVTKALNSKDMRHFGALLFAVVLAVLPALPVHAQRGGIVGTVSDTMGAVLIGVHVELSGTDFGAITNTRGEFRLTKVKPGLYTLLMRRVGFEALSMKIEVANSAPMELDFELTPTQVRLAKVDVKAVYTSDKLKSVGFEGRQKMSGIAPSRFITRAEIEKKNPASLVHLIDRIGGRVRNCVDAVVYIDGVAPGVAPDNGSGAMRTGGALRPSPSRTDNGSSHRYRPLDMIPPRTVEGMEIYASTSEIPSEFRRGQFGDANGRCVILIWTRER
jgi:hypothetical protein